MENQPDKKLYRNAEEVRAARQELNLRPVSREEHERSLTDHHRMCFPHSYLTEEDLKWFRDPEMREAYRRKYWTDQSK